MWAKINNWFFILTRNNWGLPWHIILAKTGFDLLEKWLAVNLVFGILFVIGILYEIYQMRQAKLFEGRKPKNSSERNLVTRQISNQKKDSWQDMVANLIGFILGWLL